MSTRELTEWINEKLNERHWIPANLARISGLSPATISRIGSEDRSVSIRTCKLIAKAFNVPPEVVLRIAGLMTDRPEDGPNLEEINYLLQQISEQDQILVVGIIRTIAEQRGKYEIDKKRVLGEIDQS